jgi:ribosome biogenesis protein SSF1/2
VVIRENRKFLIASFSLQLRDLLSVSGTLGVTHFVLLSQTDRTLSLRLAKAPRGPTLQFKIQSFCTAADVRATQVKPFLGGKAGLLDPPLVVLNNLGGPERHHQLMTTSFQNMFPAINVSTIKLAHCTRVVLFHLDPQTNVISVRHYRIVVNPLGLSKSVKRIAQDNRVPKLGHLKDVSDYVLSAVKASESDVEDEEDARIDFVQAVKGELNRKVHGKKKQRPEGSDKGAIRLQELGPRIEMTLAKIQAGFCEGEIMWHWQGLEQARLKEQRKKRLTLGDKAPSDFPGLQQVRRMEEEEKKALALEAKEAKDKERREKEERKKRKEAKRVAKEAKRALKKIKGPTPKGGAATASASEIANEGSGSDEDSSEAKSGMDDADD